MIAKEEITMRYLFAIICPPLAVLLCGKPFSALLNLFLTCIFWIPGCIHAFAVVNSYKNEKALKRIERTIEASAKVAHRDALKRNF